MYLFGDNFGQKRCSFLACCTIANKLKRRKNSYKYRRNEAIEEMWNGSVKLWADKVLRVKLIRVLIFDYFLLHKLHIVSSCKIHHSKFRFNCTRWNMGPQRVVLSVQMIHHGQYWITALQGCIHDRTDLFSRFIIEWFMVTTSSYK